MNLPAAVALTMMAMLVVAAAWCIYLSLDDVITRRRYRRDDRAKKRLRRDQRKHEETR